MSYNLLLTGTPGVGKTTAIQSVAKQLTNQGFRAGGIYCPEMRENDQRVGFEIIDVMTHQTEILAHVDQESGPSVGKYRVNVPNVDAVCETAFRKAHQQADFIMIDEIAPMEIYNNVFRQKVVSALDDFKPVIAVIHQKAHSGFIGKVKKRPDVEIREITKANRGRLPKKLADQVKDMLQEKNQ